MQRFTRILGIFFAVVCLTSSSGSLALAQSADETKAASEAISPRVIVSHVKFLSDDLLEGRAPGTRGDQVAELYIETQYKWLGLKPIFPNGSWRQPFDIVGINSKVAEPVTFKAKEKTVSLKPADDIVAFTGIQEPAVAVQDAELVFVGYGIVAPEQKWDDYKDVDVSGKVLLMMNNDPSSDPSLFAGKTRLYYGRWTYKYEIAAQKGAAGAIVIHTTPSAGYPFKVVQTSWSGEQFELPQANEPHVKLKAWTTEEATRKIVALSGKNFGELLALAERRDFKPVPLGVTVSLSFENEIRNLKTANVVGVLPGTDPNLSKEYVVYSAHHDHLGIGKPVNGDSIYNGALDNASGVATMLSVAEAFTLLPESARPKRSILFAAVAAEESGLLGSQKLASDPPVPTGFLAANLNLDGLNIWGKTKDATIIGLGKSSLDEIVREAATSQGRMVKADQFPDRGFFYRSDQFNFAKVGVPAISFDTGTQFVGEPAGWGTEQIEKWEATHYHQVSDEYNESWDLGGMVEDGRLAFLVGLNVANAEKMPVWNPGDEFEAARKQALSKRADASNGTE